MQGVPIRKIHKALFDETIRSGPKDADKVLLAMAIKAANKARKYPADTMADMIVALFLRQSNDLAKKIINHDTQERAERDKSRVMDDFVQENRTNGKWFYLASSHDDCAKDHEDWQGKLYVDDKAPAEVIEYARSRGLYTLQWVMDRPVWLITRPNCRHYFVAMGIREVKRSTITKLKKRHKTHTREGDREFQTPRHAMVEEYTDRLRMLRALYREHPTEKLKKEIQKAELLVKKWKNSL